MKGSFAAFLRRLSPDEDFRSQLLVRVKYALIYLIALVYWEFLLRTQTGFEDISFYFLLFLPAVAMLLAAFSGWFKQKGNRISTPIIMLLPFTYYVCQLVYFRIFGSLFSISMIGMGADAVVDFGWALADTLKDSVGWIILCFLPVAGAIIVSYFAPNKLFNGFDTKTHIFSFTQVLYLWIFAFLLILPFGKGEFSPYYAFTSAYIDTDTASDRLGVLTNSIVEIGHKFFGFQGVDGDNPLKPPAQLDPSLDNPVDTEPSIDTSPNIIDSIDFNALKQQTKISKIFVTILAL